MALLRGINVGGKNKLPMAALAAIFEDAGCRAVRTYIQSGNVVFEAGATLARRVPRLVADAIASRLGLAIPVVARTAVQLDAVVRGNPWMTPGADLEALHVAFLAGEPAASDVAGLDPDRSPPDAFVVRGSEIYLRCPGGIGKTKLTNAYFDARLKTVSTVRNWRTVVHLAAITRGEA